MKRELSFLLLALLLVAGCPNPQNAAPPADTTPPTGTIIINNDDSYTVSTSVTLALSAADDNGSAAMQMRIANTSDFAEAGWQSFAPSLVWTLQEGDGPKTVYAAFRDAAGNLSEVYSDAIALDTTLPGPPGQPDLAEEDDTGLFSNDNITQRTNGLTFSGTVEGSVTAVHLYEHDGVQERLLGSTTADNGVWTLELSLEEGNHMLYARTEDVVGPSPSSAPLALVVDTTSPGGAPGILKPAPGHNTGADKRPRFAWTAVADAGAYELQVDDASDFSNPDYHWSNLGGTSHQPDYDLNASGAVPVGTRYYLRMRALDTAGNAGAWSHAGGGAPLRYFNVGRFDNDFNGDGYADLIVGANFGAGKAFVYFGEAAPDGTADLILTGEASGDSFGWSVASAGDVNADGYADAIVGAFDYGSTKEGRAYIFYGGSAMQGGSSASANVKITGLPNSYLGFSVSTAGDVNADGYADVFVGAPFYNNNYQGLAYLFHGGPSMSGLDSPTEANLILSDTTGTSDRYGWSVATAGDENGDGYADVIVGAYVFSGSTGRAYLYHGGPTMSATADHTLTGGGTSYFFGSSVAAAGDVDGDGYGDVVVGADNFDGSRGRTYLYWGGPSMHMGQPAHQTLDGEATSSRFGISVASAGDVDRDGYADLLIGADYYSGRAGKAYLYRGGPSRNINAPLGISGAGELNGYFGYSVAPAGDVNGDGYADMVVGAWGENGSNGRAYLFRGAADLSGVSRLPLSGGSGYFGRSVASADRERRKAAAGSFSAAAIRLL